MEIITCIICGNKKYTPFVKVSDRLSQNPELFQLVKCECNFIYLNPRPSEDIMSDYYNYTEYDPHNFTKKNIWGKIYKLVQWMTLRWKFKKIAPFHSSGKLLDIGGGNGEFASFMAQKGWDVILQDKFSILDNMNEDINIKTVENLEMIKEVEYFNVITLWHSLEHIHNI